ncbi:hypothetical protein P7C70_g5411, partial [Phenoliferia sp. Uapishka_3]
MKQLVDLLARRDREAITSTPAPPAFQPSPSLSQQQHSTNDDEAQQAGSFGFQAKSAARPSQGPQNHSSNNSQPHTSPSALDVPLSLSYLTPLRGNFEPHHLTTTPPAGTTTFRQFAPLQMAFGRPELLTPPQPSSSASKNPYEYHSFSSLPQQAQFATPPHQFQSPAQSSHLLPLQPQAHSQLEHSASQLQPQYPHFTSTLHTLKSKGALPTSETEQEREMWKGWWEAKQNQSMF